MMKNPSKPTQVPQTTDTNFQALKGRSASAPESAVPDWELATKLFIPKIGGEVKRSTAMREVFGHTYGPRASAEEGVEK